MYHNMEQCQNGILVDPTWGNNAEFYMRVLLVGKKYAKICLGWQVWWRQRKLNSIKYIFSCLNTKMSFVFKPFEIEMRLLFTKLFPFLRKRGFGSYLAVPKAYLYLALCLRITLSGVNVWIKMHCVQGKHLNLITIFIPKYFFFFWGGSKYFLCGVIVISCFLSWSGIICTTFHSLAPDEDYFF